MHARHNQRRIQLQKRPTLEAGGQRTYCNGCMGEWWDGEW